MSCEAGIKCLCVTATNGGLQMFSNRVYNARLLFEHIQFFQFLLSRCDGAKEKRGFCFLAVGNLVWEEHVLRAGPTGLNWKPTLYESHSSVQLGLTLVKRDPRVIQGRSGAQRVTNCKVAGKKCILKNVQSHKFTCK